jgi:hypothetical protein
MPQHLPQMVSHRDLVSAYLLAQAGLPFTLRVDAAGQTRTLALPAQPRAAHTVS